MIIVMNGCTYLISYRPRDGVKWIISFAKSPSCPCAHPHAHLCCLWPCAILPRRSTLPALTCWSLPFSGFRLLFQVSPVPCGPGILQTVAFPQLCVQSCPATPGPACEPSYALFAEGALDAFLFLADAASGLILFEPVELVIIGRSGRGCFLVCACLVGESEGLLIVGVCMDGEVQAGCAGASENSKAS